LNFTSSTGTGGGGDELGELAVSFNQMAAALAANERQRQQLFADIAHELRTPLSVIRAQLEAMLDGVLELSPENLSLAHEETISLDRLVDELRALSLAESGQLPLDKRPLDLGMAVVGAKAAFEPLAEADGIHLELSTEPELPHVPADEARIQQVLGNLLSNALRHAGQAEATEPEVRLEVTRVSGAVRVSVSDNGLGLEREAQRHVLTASGAPTPAAAVTGVARGWAWPLARGSSSPMAAKSGSKAPPIGGRLSLLSCPSPGGDFHHLLDRAIPHFSANLDRRIVACRSLTKVC
jgi:signal transduction histidine kinase